MPDPAKLPWSSAELPWPHVDRSAPDVAAQVAAAVRVLAPEFSDGALPRPARFAALAALGARDLVLARLVEGHLDAVTILHEAGREAGPGVYGVWASASGGTGLTARPGGDGWIVDGLMRFASGAAFVDRALTVAADPAGAKLLLDLDVAEARGGALIPLEDTWRAVGMDASASVDVEVRDLHVGPTQLVGAAGFYLDRPGFALGGAGVAAVWLGGAEGLLQRAAAALRDRSNPHALAHLGAVRVRLAAARALLEKLADDVEHGRTPDVPDAVAVVRGAVEAAVQDTLVHIPRAVGPTPLSRDGAFGHQLADLQVYVRQHHAEAELEQLGAALVPPPRLREVTPRGNPPELWHEYLDGLPDVELPPAGRVVVIGAHPDDETLGAGGLIQRLVAAGHQVQVVSLTDGEAAYDLPGPQRLELADRRREELAAALAELGVTELPLSVGVGDLEVEDATAEIMEVLEDQMRDAALAVVTWEHDPHPDHAAAGRAALAAGARLGVPVWQVPVWMRHRLDPGDALVPHGRLAVLRLTEAEQVRKEAAVARHVSQVSAPPAGSGPILPDHVLALFADRLEPVVVP